MFVLGAALFAAPAVWGSFDDVGAGARGAGMADAQTAVADDASAAFNNPAGLIQVGDQRIGTDFGQYVRGLSDGSQLGTSFLGYVRPIKPGRTVLSAGYRSFKATDIVEEKTYLLGGGTRLDIAPFGWEGVWSIGGNVKMLERSFNTDSYAGNAINDAGVASGRPDPVLNAGNRTALSLDGGVMYQFGRNLENSAGLVILNGNRPNLSKTSNDHAPEIVKFGVAHRPRWGVITAEVRHAYRLTGNPDTDLALGAERNFRLSNYSAAVIRGGYAEGSRGYQVATLGAAYFFGRFSFDYAVSFPMGNLGQTDGAQHMGFSMRFGGSTATVKTPFLPPLVQPVSVSTTTAPEMERAVKQMEQVPDVEDDVKTLQREIDALRKAANLTPAASTAPASVAPSTATVVPSTATVTPPVVQVSTPAAQPTAKPVHPKPVAKPLKTARPHPAASPTAVKAAPKPTAAAESREAEEAWQFYQEAVSRDISDQEKIELLESMVERFGEKQAPRVQAELDKLRKRVKRAQTP